MIRCDVDSLGYMHVEVPGWAGFQLTGLRPMLRVDGSEREPDGQPERQFTSGGMTVLYRFQPLTLVLRFDAWETTGVALTASLVNDSPREMVLEDVSLLRVVAGPGVVCFGDHPERVRILEQGNYWGRVRPLARPPPSNEAAATGEPAGFAVRSERASELVWLAYDPDAGKALLVGFLTSERWLGRIQMSVTPAGQVTSWRVGFDGGDLNLAGHQRLELESLVLFTGENPWEMLETYAERVRKHHHPVILDGPIVSWCSWYPYRLGVTEERVLENARIAAKRLSPLGFKVIEVDLGWETGNLPSSFTENDRFPHGLKWLANELRTLGLDLGVWKAPFTISEYDSIASEHPECLVQDAEGRPKAYWEWFWEPHGKVFILDLTHPGALEWLRKNIQSLGDRGAKYLKFDFIGCVMSPAAKQRYDRRVVGGGGTEAARIAARTIREVIPDALILNCGGPEMPGNGHWPLLYSCNDTGNSGFISHNSQAENYEALACHLFKNRRWGILQPSCLVVGLPGTLEDARLRATAAFLAGGQIDISDTLTTLPEDRWRILTATLPPLGLTARPVDLFEPLPMAPFDYEATCRGKQPIDPSVREHPPGCVWHLHVEAPWDDWDLVGVFCYSAGSSAPKPEISRFAIPLARLAIPESQRLWGYEFWSGQFLGDVPGKRRNPSGYVHPGDFQDLTVSDAPGMLDIAFFGPGVKLLSLRRPRPHPWVAGTSFHQSCGMELRAVRWNPSTRTLSGEVHRPPGESGFIVIHAAGMAPVRQEVDGREVSLLTSAGQSLTLNMVVGTSPAHWSVRFG